MSSDNEDQSAFNVITTDLPQELKQQIWKSVIKYHVEIRDVIKLIGQVAELDCLIADALKTIIITLTESKTSGINYTFGCMEGSLPLDSRLIPKLQNFLRDRRINLICDFPTDFLQYSDEYAVPLERFKYLAQCCLLKFEDLIFWKGSLSKLKKFGWQSRVSKIFIDLECLTIEEITLLREFKSLEELGIGIMHVEEEPSSRQMIALKDSIDSLHWLKTIRFVESPSSESTELISLCTKAWLDETSESNKKVTCEIYTSPSDGTSSNEIADKLSEFLTSTNLYPSNVTSFSINNTDFPDFQLINRFEKLIALSISSAKFINYEFKHSVLSRLSLADIHTKDYDLSHLVRLSHVYLGECILTQSFFKSLPESLLYLRISDCSDEGTPIYQLPSWLESIEIISERFFPVFTTTGENARLRHIELAIPTSILDESVSDLTVIPELFFQCLPKSVKSMHIHYSKDLDEMFWKTINLTSMTSLEDLTIELEISTNFNFSLLPPSLKKLKVDSCITGFQFNSSTFLCTNLEELNLTFPLLADDHFKALNRIISVSKIAKLTLQAKQRTFDLRRLDFGKIRRMLLRSDYFEIDSRSRSWVLTIQLESIPETLYRFDLEYTGQMTGKMQVYLELPLLTDRIYKSGLASYAKTIVQTKL